MPVPSLWTSMALASTGAALWRLHRELPCLDLLWVLCGGLLQNSCLRRQYQSAEWVSPGQESNVRMGLNCKAAQLSLWAEQHSGVAKESHIPPFLAAHTLTLSAHSYFCDCTREECCISCHHFHMKKMHCRKAPMLSWQGSTNNP